MWVAFLELKGMREKSNIFIIAEAGVNHNGSLELAKSLVDVAVQAGADAVKFQTFRTELCITKNARRANYQKKEGESNSQYELVKALELSEIEFQVLSEYCNKKNITFLSTGFDLPSLNFLDEVLDIPIIKIPSGDILNGPLLLRAARAKKPILLSTGMCDLGDIENALSVLAFGLLGRSDKNANLSNFKDCFYSDGGQNILRKFVTLLHCTTEYPVPLEDVNLRALHTLSKSFCLPIGFSDHSLGIHMPLGAVALGASVIEKHFTLDQSLSGPDHRASLSPRQLNEMVSNIRDFEKSMGDGMKYPRKSERSNIEIARKYLVCSHPIASGEIFTMDNLIAKRSSRGISPIYIWDLLGKKANKEYLEGDVIEYPIET